MDEKLLNTKSVGELVEKVKDKFGEAVSVSAKLEEELIDLDPAEGKSYLKEMGTKESALEQLISKSYKLLSLISFYTIKGGQEVHAWSLRKGSTALEAAAIVHTDFAQKFIKAEVINIDQLLSLGSWKKALEKGKISLEGKDYPVQNKDVIEFKHSQ